MSFSGLPRKTKEVDSAFVFIILIGLSSGVCTKNQPNEVIMTIFFHCFDSLKEGKPIKL